MVKKLGPRSRSAVSDSSVRRHVHRRLVDQLWVYGNRLTTGAVLLATMLRSYNQNNDQSIILTLK